MRRKTIATILIISVLILLCGCIADFETLKVTLCIPENHGYGISQDARVLMEFNNPVNKEKVEQYFFLGNGDGLAEGGFNWTTDKSFVFVPRYDLDVGSRYTIELPRDVEDTKGNKMEMDFLSDFYVGVDLERPRVLSSDPLYTQGGTMNVPVNQNIVITFSKVMNQTLTEQAFSLGPDASGYFSWNSEGTELTYHLTSSLDYGRQYKLTVSSSAEDTTGNTLDVTYTVIFITGDDFDYPVINGINVDGMAVPPYWDPLAVNNNISRFDPGDPNCGTPITVYFSEEMNISSAESAFTLTSTSTSSVPGVFTWRSTTFNNDTMTFSPGSPLKSETLYTVRIYTTAEDINGRYIQEEYLVRFSTNAADSLNVMPGDVWGSNDNAAYILLFTIMPALWPVDIGDMGISGEDDYYFQIEFRNTSNTVVAMDPYSIFDNIIVEGFSDLNSPQTVDVTWNPGNTIVTISLQDLSNDQDDAAVLYRLTIVGGETGIKDSRGNKMKGDFVFEFRE